MTIRKRISTILLMMFFTGSFIIPTFAAETDKQILILEEVQELAVQNSRIVKSMDLTLDQADRQVRILKSDLNKLRYGTSVGVYDSIQGLEKIKESLENLRKSLLEAEEPNEDMLNNVNYQLAINNKSIMDLSQQRSSISSAQKQLRDALENAVDMEEDLERTYQDLEKQLQYQAAQLVFNIFQMEDSLKLLEKSYAQQMQMTEIARLQKELGMVTTVDVDSRAVQASITNKQLQQLKENYQVLKRSLNDLIGREPDAPLQLVRYTVNETLTPAPSYGSIIDEIKKNAYDLYKMDRDIDNLEDDLDDTDGSNEKLIAKANVEKSKLDRVAKEIEIENKVKTTLANYSEKLKAHQLSQIDFKTAEQSYIWDQRKFELGMISSVQLKGSELAYLNAYNSKEKAAYDYYLAKNELEMLKQGIFISTGTSK